jgi:hypothetical protein
MFTKDVRFEGFSTEDWGRLLGLLKRPAEPGAEGPHGGLLVIHDEGRVRKLLHTSLGRLDKDAETWPTPLAALAAKYGGRWVLAARAGGLEKLAERWGERARQTDDIASQGRRLLDLLRELSAEGVLELWPNHLERLVLPPWPILENTFEAVFPPGHLCLLALFDHGELWTSVGIERARDGISRIVGPDDLRPRLSFLSGDFRRDYRYTLAAAQETWGPVAFGLFTELSIFRELQNEKAWQAWVRAVAIRDIVLTPPRGPLATPLAADAAVWLAAIFSSLGRRWDHSMRLMLSLWHKGR